MLAIFKPELRIVVSRLGKDSIFDTAKIRADLEFQPMDLTQTIQETTDSLIQYRIA